MSRGDGFDLGGDGRRFGDRRETAFRPRLSRARGESPHSFIGKVNKAVAKARAASGRTKLSGTSGRFNARGRGAKVAPGLKGHGAWTVEHGMRFRARRAVVKARVVKLAGGGSKAAQAHLRYLMREGAGLDRSAEDIAAERARPDEFDLQRDRAPETARDAANENALSISLAAPRDGAARDAAEDHAPEPRHARSDLYTAFTDDVDVKGFLKRGMSDRHQFRFIVSPEDGAELGDFRPLMRGLMRDIERDLGMRLVMALPPGRVYPAALPSPACRRHGTA